MKVALFIVLLAPTLGHCGCVVPSCYMVPCSRTGFNPSCGEGAVQAPGHMFMSSPQHRETWASNAIAFAESWPLPVLRDTSEEQLPYTQLNTLAISLLTSWTSAFTGKWDVATFSDQIQ